MWTTIFAFIGFCSITFGIIICIVLIAVTRTKAYDLSQESEDLINNHKKQKNDTRAKN